MEYLVGCPLRPRRMVGRNNTFWSAANALWIILMRSPFQTEVFAAARNECRFADEGCIPYSRRGRTGAPRNSTKFYLKDHRRCVLSWTPGVMLYSHCPSEPLNLGPMWTQGWGCLVHGEIQTCFGELLVTLGYHGEMGSLCIKLRHQHDDRWNMQLGEKTLIKILQKIGFGRWCESCLALINFLAIMVFHN